VDAALNETLVGSLLEGGDDRRSDDGSEGAGTDDAGAAAAGGSLEETEAGEWVATRAVDPAANSGALALLLSDHEADELRCGAAAQLCASLQETAGGGAAAALLDALWPALADSARMRGSAAPLTTALLTVVHGVVEVSRPARTSLARTPQRLLALVRWLSFQPQQPPPSASATAGPLTSPAPAGLLILRALARVVFCDRDGGSDDAAAWSRLLMPTDHTIADGVSSALGEIWSEGGRLAVSCVDWNVFSRLRCASIASGASGSAA